MEPNKINKSYKFSFLASFMVVFCLFINTAWADQYGRATIAIPKYMADFFIANSYEEVKDTHFRLYELNGGVKEYKELTAPVNVTFTWKLQGNRFTTSLISTIAKDGVMTENDYNKLKRNITFNVTSDHLTFQNTIPGTEFISKNRNMTIFSSLTYEIMVDNNNNVKYNFVYYAQGQGDAFKSRNFEGEVKGEINYKAAMPLPRDEGFDEIKGAPPARDRKPSMWEKAKGVFGGKTEKQKSDD
ncbi:MAG: hypothetical protein K0R94_1194 [Burkholderiales bacterium]|jgi:hypothetical protein|nr:hypothetical protein [Burkholderiales bacterium]